MQQDPNVTPPSTKSLKRTAEDAGLETDDDGIRKILKHGLLAVAKNLERDKQSWIKARRHHIETAVALLSHAEAKIQTSGLILTDRKILLPGDEPDEDATSVTSFAEEDSWYTLRIADLLAKTTPELDAYFRKESAQSVSDQNGNRFWIYDDDDAAH